jgi:trehalose-6-phosphatase
VSGRALIDIRERVGLANLIYAGNHGLEISEGGLNFVEPDAVQRTKLLGELSRRLRERLRMFPAWQSKTKFLLRPYIFGGFSGAAGTKSERRPRMDWNRGAAVRWIEAMRGSADTFTFYIGDDLTDEDAFSALPTRASSCSRYARALRSLRGSR